jgi:hypothetical protein
MKSALELITTITPSVLAAGSTVSTYYRDKSELIIFIINILKVFMIIISFSYLAYLYYGKNQLVKETLLWVILTEKIITFIFVIIGIYLIYNSNKEKIKTQAINLKNNIKSIKLKKK